MSRLTQDGTAEPVLLDQISGANGEREKLLFSFQDEQDLQPYPVDPYSAESADHTYPDHTPLSSRTCARMPHHGTTPSLI